MNKNFENEKRENIRQLGLNKQLKEKSTEWIVDTSHHKYSYNFSWLGRPVIQFPQDMMAMQEIIWQVKSDLIVETGIVHGGSLLFYSSMSDFWAETVWF